MLTFIVYFALTVNCISCSSLVEVFRIDLQPQQNGKPFSFASFYQDHMVLQATPWQAVVWGYNTPDSVGKTVTVSVLELNTTYTSLVGTDFKWSVKMDPIESGGPCTVQALFEDKKISIKDVLFGDIWLCSGQSNMKFSMSQVFNATEEMKDALNYPSVRIFTVDDITSQVPLEDLPAGSILQPWALPTPATLGMGAFKSFSAVCWLYGKYLYQHIKKPIGLIDTSWGGTPVEAWSSPDALKKCGLDQLESVIKQETSNPEVLSDTSLFDSLHGPQENSLLWNAMIHPFLNMTIYGAIWYQGENNAYKNMNLYNCMFPSMIVDWRRKFHQSSGTSSLFPFGFVQLAGNEPSRDIQTGFSDIRWHQTADYGYVPNHKMRKVFMAVAMDLPDFLCPYGSVHPRDKQDVAQRLVQSSLAVAYNQSVVFQGPFPVHVTIEDWAEGAKIHINFTTAVEEREFEGFELCCSFVNPPVCQAGKSWWIPVPVVVEEGSQASTASTLLSMSCNRTQIVGVRYAWYESPCAFKKCAIYGKDSGLPMPPFTFAGEEFLDLAGYV